jgi:hypothetical protein
MPIEDEATERVCVRRLRERTGKPIELPGNENIAFSHKAEGLRVPDDEASLIRLYQLGMAVQLGQLRYPGFGLRLDEDAQLSLVY